MFFVVMGRFRKGVEQQCTALNLAFSDHLASHNPRIRIGGPLRDAAGAKSGVFYIAESPDRDAMAAFARASPYSVADVYESVTIDEITLEIGHMG